MPEDLILNESWAEYDAYKQSKTEDPTVFNPWDNFETTFLENRIHKYYPQYTELTVRLSISHVKRLLHGGCRRPLFVKMVVANLIQRQPLVTQ